VCGSGAVVLGSGWGVLALLVVLPVFFWSRRDRLGSRRTLLELATIVYLDILLSLTLLPLPLPPYDLQAGDCALLLLVPFGTIWPAIQTSLNSPEWHFLAGNVLAFVPVGILVPLWRPADRRLRLTVLVVGFSLSLAIELGQLIGSLIVGFNYRQADVDDLIVNTVGAVAGYALLVGTKRLLAALATRPD
jgi:glycopeptide antibiotics resistance protein